LALAERLDKALGMRLPGRLKLTTLGDLLGSLHRAQASGTLELVEDSGRTHRVHLRLGRVSAIEVDGAAPQLAELLRERGAIDDGTLRRSILRSIASRRLVGDVLVTEFAIDPRVVSAAVRQQLQLKLERLDRLPDARVAFRVTAPVPRGALSDDPLAASEFLRGKKRARERMVPAPSTWEDFQARRVLGVEASADTVTVKRAYRQLARSLHPDTHPNATAEERRDLSERFAALTAAYRRLSA
jgi:DnaJ-domain-containing protein 1